jgi:hypothetical protein
MIGAVYFDQDVFGIGVKLIEGGIHGRVVGEAFEPIDLRLECIASGLCMVHGVHVSHNLISFPIGLCIPFFHKAE